MPFPVESSGGRPPDLRRNLALNALERAIWEHSRTGKVDLDGLVHHSDCGVRYLSIRYTERLAANDIVGSVGSRGDSFDNALAESITGLYETEQFHNRGPWRGLDDLALATLVWVGWFNHRRIFHKLGRIPTAEHKPTTTLNTSHANRLRLTPPGWVNPGEVHE